MKKIGLLSFLFFFPSVAFAGAELSAGVWWVYQNAYENNLDDETGGTFADPALIVYGSDDGSHGPWSFSSEMRIGTGSFTNAVNNNSQDNFTMHKAWIGYQVSDESVLRVGKSQVPFGWKTHNFWPGDILQGGYGDQMDVGFKFSSSRDRLSYDVAYYHQDDWGETSTDTVDDNNHWGTSTTYRKIKTGVLNVDYELIAGHTIGLSYQQGRMQDLTVATPPGVSYGKDTGEHDAVDLHYYYQNDGILFQYRYIQANRDFSDMDALVASCGGGCFADDEVETTRHAAHLGYRKDKWHFYLEGSSASSDTQGNSASGEAFAPGVSYQYGPGWLYLEYLWQNAFIDTYGDVGEGDFRSVYASFDFYF